MLAVGAVQQQNKRRHRNLIMKLQYLVVSNSSYNKILKTILGCALGPY